MTHLVAAFWATGGASAAASAMGATTVKTAVNIKLASTLKELSHYISGKTLGFDKFAERLRKNIKGIGEWGVYQPIKDKPCPLHDGKIDFSKQRDVLRQLRNLPQDTPIKDLFGSANIEDMGFDGDSREAVFAKEFRDFLTPLCDEKTTAKDLVGSFRGFFESLAQHAVKKPEDFIIHGDSEGMYPRDADSIRIHRNEIENIISILKEYEKKGEPSSPLLEQLKSVNEKNEKLAKDRIFLREKARFEEQYAQEDKKREAHSQQVRDRNERQAREAEERAIQRKENPHVRSPRYVSLEHIEGDKYAVQPNDRGLPLPTRADWLHWLQKHNPSVAAHHI